MITCAVAAAGPWLARRRLWAAAAVPLAVGCVIAALLVPVAWVQGQLVVSSLPAFEGMPLSQISEDETERVVQGIRPGESLFFVTETAGFFYLVTGAHDPTPYDVPATSNIGSRELASIGEDVRSGTIGRACFGGRRAYTENPSLRPFAVERVLRRELRPVADLGCAFSMRVTRPGDRKGRRKADSSLDQCFAVTTKEMLC